MPLESSVSLTRPVTVLKLPFLEHRGGGMTGIGPSFLELIGAEIHFL